MKKNLLILFAFLSIEASNLLEYELEVKYIFDSNIAQNTKEIPKHYVVPEIGLTLYPFPAVDLFVAGEMIYDCYVKERDADDNSPFVTGGLGIKLGRKKFRVIPEFYMEQYLMADGYTLNKDGEWIEDPYMSFLRTFNFKTSLVREKKKIAIEADAMVGYKDYHKDVKESKKEGVELNLEPKISYLFNGKDEGLRFKSISFGAKYEGRFTDLDVTTLNKVMLFINTDIRFWRAKIDAAFELGRKVYIGLSEHPESGEDINEVINYMNIKPEIEIDIISDLEISIGGELRFRSSNFENEEFNRHTFFAGVKWDSKFKRKK